MTVYFSLVVIIALICVAIAISTLYSNKLLDEMNQVTNQKFELLLYNLDNSVSKIKNLHSSIINNDIIYNNMEYLKDKGSLSKKKRQEIIDEFDRHKKKEASIISIFAVDTRNQILDPLYNNHVFNWLVTDNKEFQYFRNQVMLSMFTAPNTFPLQFEDPEKGDKSTITYYGNCYRSNNYETLGSIVINIKKSSLFYDMMDRNGNSFDYICVINGKNQIVYDQGEFKDWRFLGSKELFRKLDGKLLSNDTSKYLSYASPLKSYSDWRIICLKDYKQVTAQIREIYFIIFAILSVMLIIIILISFYIAQKITNPIRKIISSMELLGSGEWPEMLEAETEDELYQLITGFNEMTVNIRGLQKKVLEDEEQKQKVEIAMMKSRIDLLQSQINPHFIHNTLNTLKYMAKKAGAAELVETITSFNALLRTSMSQGNDLITVKEEIENLKNYIKIQRYRYDEEFRFRCYSNDKTDYLLLPKLILQPLVENSLFHGIIPKRGGEIVIAFDTDQRYLYVSISDNGAGIIEEEQKDIWKHKSSSMRGYNNIGLANINERLFIYYGEESSLNLKSSTLYGTFISFKIPYMK